MNAYRVFISYSHEDVDLVLKIVEIIEKNGLIPLWDKNFSFGIGFQDSIKTFIAHAHVFLPVVTESSSERGWVHQEIGYAMALNVPVLPVALGTLPGEMMRELHAVQLKDLGELKDKLSRKIFDKLVNSYQDASLALFQCAKLSEDRAKMIAKYANDVSELMDAHGCVRQKGILGSFHIPDKAITHPEWDERDGNFKSSEYYRQRLREERLALVKHVKMSGCRLIINPYHPLEKFGVEARIVRLKSLIEFLESLPDDKVQVVINPKIQNENLTIVGDWFAAESVSAILGRGYRQTIFTRHAPSVQKMIEEFDQEFKELLQALGWTFESSRAVAIDTIKEIIADLQNKQET